jgi:hypothetical protein
MQYAPHNESEQHYISNRNIKATANRDASVEMASVLCYALIVRADNIGY